ncbi:MAG TPA: hypothetical protein VGM16_08020, partial [Gammaproteobacteria bacterium]
MKHAGASYNRPLPLLSYAREIHPWISRAGESGTCPDSPYSSPANGTFSAGASLRPSFRLYNVGMAKKDDDNKKGQSTIALNKRAR